MNFFSVHRIFPPGMTIYQCTEKNCNFVTGSRISFSRHVHRPRQVRLVIHTHLIIDELCILYRLFFRREPMIVSAWFVGRFLQLKAV